MDSRIERLGDEQAIRDTLARYWRGIDRQDAELVGSTYHPTAYDDHGYYKGPVAGFLESLQPGVWDYFENTQHFSGHIAVEPSRIFLVSPCPGSSMLTDFTSRPDFVFRYVAIWFPRKFG